MTQTLFVDKASGTFADPLLAYGLAIVVGDVLRRTAGRGQAAVHLSDRGSYYCLECVEALDDARLATVTTPYMPAVVLRTRKKAATLPSRIMPKITTRIFFMVVSLLRFCPSSSSSAGRAGRSLRRPQLIRRATGLWSVGFRKIQRCL